MTTFAATNASTLSAALLSAVGGDRIEMTAGNYGSLDIRGVTFSSDVTIVSADPANPAIVSNLDIRDSSHLVLDGILFDYVNATEDPETSAKLAYVYTSSYITIRNSVFNGDEVPSANGSGAYGSGMGLIVHSSSNVVVENNEFFNFYKAIIANYSTNIVVSHNDVHSLRSDGFNFVSVDGLLIEGNWIRDFKRDFASGDHGDMIQLWTVLGKMASQNVIIRGNFLDTGTGDYSQALFVQTGLSGGTYEDDVWKNLLIEHNVIYADHLHGITVGKTDGLTINNNTLLHDPHTASFKGWAPQINLNVESVNVSVNSNITADVWNWAVMIGQPGWVVTNNLLLEYDPTSPDYYVPLFVNPLAINATLADLRAVAGGVIEQTIVGAAMTRADIPMLAGPYATAPLPDPVPEPGVCETLLAEALAVVADLEGQLILAQSALVIRTGERDTALTERDIALGERNAALALLTTAETALTTMTAERNAALAAQALVEAALVDMTTERDAALAKLAAILVIAGG